MQLYGPSSSATIVFVGHRRRRRRGFGYSLAGGTIAGRWPTSQILSTLATIPKRAARSSAGPSSRSATQSSRRPSARTRTSRRSRSGQPHSNARAVRRDLRRNAVHRGARAARRCLRRAPARRRDAKAIRALAWSDTCSSSDPGLAWSDTCQQERSGRRVERHLPAVATSPRLSVRPSREGSRRSSRKSSGNRPATELVEWDRCRDPDPIGRRRAHRDLSKPSVMLTG